MLFSPNTFERYIASLRFYVHLSIAKHGLQIKHLQQLKLIYISEAINNKKYTSPIDIIKLSNSILGACVIVFLSKGKNLAVSFRGSGNYLINKKLYIALILSIAEMCEAKGSEIIIYAEDDKILIKAYGCYNIKNAKVIIKALNGSFYREVKTNTTIIAIPATKTLEKSIYIENEWCNLTDRVSPVNVFLSKI